MDQATSILLVDDHDAILRGLRGLLRREPNIEVIGQTADGSEALQLVDRLRPDMLVLDIRLHGTDGFEIVRRLRTEGRAVGIILLSIFSEDDYIYHAIEMDVEGYLLKDDADKLASIIRRISSGERRFFSRKLFKDQIPNPNIILVD